MIKTAVVWYGKGGKWPPSAKILLPAVAARMNSQHVPLKKLLTFIFSGVVLLFTWLMLNGPYFASSSCFSNNFHTVDDCCSNLVALGYGAFTDQKKSDFFGLHAACQVEKKKKADVVTSQFLCASLKFVHANEVNAAFLSIKCLYQLIYSVWET